MCTIQARALNKYNNFSSELGMHACVLTGKSWKRSGFWTESVYLCVFEQDWERHYYKGEEWLLLKRCLPGFTVSHTSMFLLSPRYQISQAAPTRFQAASSVLPLINKVNLFLRLLFFLRILKLPHFSPFCNIFLQLTGKSSLHLSDPHSRLITRVLLSVIFPSSSAAVVTNGT